MKAGLVSISRHIPVKLHPPDITSIGRHSVFIANVRRSGGFLGESLVAVETLVSDPEMDALHVPADGPLFPIVVATGLAYVQGIARALQIAFPALSS